MAESEGTTCDVESLLIQRHKKERKEFQAEVQKLKNSVSKGDKKKRKEINEKIAFMEADLDAKHERELEELKTEPSIIKHQVTADVEIEETVVHLNNLSTSSDDHDMTKQAKQKKPSKAQKRREKKAIQDLERDERIREQEVENLTSSRHLEAVKIGELLAKRGLQIHEIPSDGNCLYAAVCHQLQQRGVQSSTKSLRQQVADYMRLHPDEFLPFLTKEDGEPYSPENFETYCRLLESTAAWGGQLEIHALSSILKVPIEVVQSESPLVMSGEQYNSPPIVLMYYRHAYGLGEHYHSVQEKKDDDKDEFT